MNFSAIFVTMYNTNLQIMGHWTFALKYNTGISMGLFSIKALQNISAKTIEIL